MVRARSRLARRVRVLAATILAGAAATALLGCSPNQGTEDRGDTAPPYSASVEIMQGRSDYTAHQIVISVTNTGQNTLPIRTATLSIGRFVTPAAWTVRPVMIPAGDTVDLRADIPAIDCDGAKGPGNVRITTTDGLTIEAVPSDPLVTIDRLVGESCLASDVAKVVTIDLPSSLRVAGAGTASTAWIDVQLSPAGGDGTVIFDQVHSTTLLSPLSGESWPLAFSLSGDTPARTLSLQIRPTRCDPHAIAEDKIGTVLPVDVSTSTGRTGRLQLAMPAEVRAEIYTFVAAVCGEQD